MDYEEHTQKSVRIVDGEVIDLIVKDLSDRGHHWETVSEVPFETHDLDPEYRDRLTTSIFMEIREYSLRIASADPEEPQWIIEINAPTKNDGGKSTIHFMGEETKISRFALWNAFHTVRCMDKRLSQKIKSGTIWHAA